MKYLPEFGWDADIITENTLKNNNYRSLLGSNRIVRVDLRYTLAPQKFIHKVWRFINLKRHFRKNKEPFLQGIFCNFKRNDYSVVLVSVSWELYILEVGVIISRKWGLPLIIDLRDIAEQKPKVPLPRMGIKTRIDYYFTASFEKMKLRLRNSALDHAKAVTSVSPYHVGVLSKYNPKVHLIYNGFNPNSSGSNRNFKSERFVIIYTGIVLNKEEQDPTILFNALSMLLEDKLIKREQFSLRFYTPENFRHNLKSNLEFYKVREFVEFYDYVDSSEIPELLNKASIGLILANSSNLNGPKGVVTTKLFDYLGAELPVLCVRSDEDILESVIKRLNIGISARNELEAYGFILGKYREWERNGYTSISVNQEYKKQFDRKVQAKQFVDIFDRSDLSMN